MPWFRRSRVLSVLVFLGLFVGITLVPVCLITLTGSVLYKKLDEQGRLKAWSPMNT